MLLKDLANSNKEIFESCANELSAICARNKKVIFINDGTIYSEFYLKALEKGRVQFSIATPDFIEKLEDRKAILILPIFKFRVFNLNFDRRSGVEYAPPYWVHISSNQLSRVGELLSQKFGRVLVNPLIELESIFKSYLLSESFLEWIGADSCLEYHNDRVDRIIIKEILEARGFEIKDMYVSHPELHKESLEEFLFRRLKIEPPSSYRHLPLHRLYKRKWNRNIEINLLERELYGNVD